MNAVNAFNSEVLDLHSRFFRGAGTQLSTFLRLSNRLITKTLTGLFEMLRYTYKWTYTISRMQKRTIYVRDETLWMRAIKVAGRRGLSAFIAEAIADLLAKRERNYTDRTWEKLPVAFSATKSRTELWVGGVEYGGHFKIGFTGGLLFHRQTDKESRRVYLTTANQILVHFDRGDTASYQVHSSVQAFAKSPKTAIDFQADDLLTLAKTLQHDFTVEVA